MVDNEPLIVKMVALVLRDMGITNIYKAYNGAEALDHFTGGINVIDLVVCDWVMPEMDGLEFLGQLRALHFETPFIMLTSQTGSDHIFSAKKLGVNAYIAKPFSPDQLHDKMDKILTKLLNGQEIR